MTNKRVGAVLERAANIIERDGWWGNAVGGDDDAKCLVQAIDTATTSPVLGTKAEQAIRNTLKLPPLAPETRWDLVNWNDKPGRTKRQVVNLLRKAARA